MHRGLSAVVVVACAAAGARGVIIDFDDRAGMLPPFEKGAPVAPEFVIDDEYLPLGVRFNSGGGGIVVSAPSNPVSGPNTAAATGPGPVLSYTHDVEATFWVANGDRGRVDHVAITLSNSSALSTMLAFDEAGALLGGASGGQSSTLSLTFAGQIHRIVIRQGPMAFDDFTFEGLVPAPGPAGAFAAAGVMVLVRRRR